MKKLLVLALFLFEGVCTVVMAQNVNIKVASVVPSRSSWDVEQHVMAQKFSQITGGKVTLHFMSATAMGGEAGVIQKLNSVRPGQVPPINGAIFTGLGISDLAPDSKILTLCVPFMFRNQEEVNVVLKEVTEDMKIPVRERGYEILGWFNVGWAYFFTKTPIRSSDELKQIKLSIGSVSSPALGYAFKAAGFHILDVPTEKLSQSMRTPGGLEGLYTLPMYAYAAQYYKNLPYVLNVPLCPVMAAFLVSKDTWSKVPEQYKAQLIQVVQDSGVKFEQNQMRDDQDYIKRYESVGGKAITLSQTEYLKFEQAFKDDSKKMYEVKNPVVDKKLYDKIMSILSAYRGE